MATAMGKRKAGSGFFGDCPRDEQGHCLPQNEADRTGHGQGQQQQQQQQKPAAGGQAAQQQVQVAQNILNQVGEQGIVTPQDIVATAGNNLDLIDTLVEQGKLRVANMNGRPVYVAGDGQKHPPQQTPQQEKPQLIDYPHRLTTDQWQAEVERLDEEYDRAMEQYQADHAAWEQEIDRLDAAHDEARAAWEKRDEERQARSSAMTDLSLSDLLGDERRQVMQNTDPQFKLDSYKLLDSPEGQKEYRARAEKYVHTVAKSFQEAYGAGLASRLEQLGAPEKSVAKIRELGDKGTVALHKAGERYLKLHDKFVEIKNKLDSLPEEPVEPDDPDDPAYAQWEEAQSKWQDQVEIGRAHV